MKNIRNIVIEVSRRLADESDYDKSLAPKLQKLLDFVDENTVNKTKNKKLIKRDMVKNWLGSDALSSDFIEIIYELASGEYEVAQMRQDIIDTD